RPPQDGSESESKCFHSPVKAKETHRPLLGGSEIQRYVLRWTGNYVDYGNWLAEPRSPDWFEGTRILIREVTAKGVIQATIVDSDFVFSNSVDCVKLFRDDYSPLFMLAVINSKLISFYNSNTSANAFKDSFPKVLIKDLLNFPVPKLALSNSADKARHDRMVALVEAMLGAKRQLAGAGTEAERNLYERKCANLDAQIDALVYELYDLTPQEIALVGGV
ncbi:MAG TPA: TaqI-like C-terminal specificity domain-containing protein, partial [Pyrinomonadaceae bacterium]